MQIQYIKFGQVLQISDPFDVVFTKHEHSKRGDRVQMWDFLDVVIVKIQEYECRQTN